MPRVGEGDLPSVPRVVVDPDVPEPDRRFILLANPKTRDSEPPERPLPIRARSSLIGLLLTERIVWRYGAVALGATVLVMLLLGESALAVLLGIGVPVLYGLLWVVTGVKFGEYPQERIWRLHHDRFITVGELDESGRELLARAQRAIDIVLSSEVNAVGVLDKIHNKVALPRWEWELAKALRGLARLRATESGAGGSGPGSAAVADAAAKVTDRVAALEEYAARVRAADAAYHVAALEGQMGAAVDDLSEQAQVAMRSLEDSARRFSELGDQPGVL